MGLFSRDSPAEKKLKELTGGFILNNNFIKLLKDNNLTVVEGTKIKNQLKEEIEEGKVDEYNLEFRLMALVRQYGNNSGESVSQKPSKPKIRVCPNCKNVIFDNGVLCPECGHNFKTNVAPPQGSQNSDFADRTIFLSSFDFNLKTCPECGTEILKSEPFCYNCGAAVLTGDTVKNDNLVVKDGKLTVKSPDDELSSLESLYSKTVSSRYSPSFRYAYVLYLDGLKNDPLSGFPEKTARRFSTTPDELKIQAIDDGFVEKASPILQAHSFRVSDLKDILRENGLPVSGKKDEIIERLGENLTDEELGKYFKSDSYEISQAGIDFVEKNSYVIYIDSTDAVSRVISPEEVVRIFDEKPYSQDEIHSMILEYLKRVFDDKLNGEVWVDFKVYSNAIAEVCHDMGDLRQTLKTLLKLFLFNINNISLITYEPYPKDTKLIKKDAYRLTDLLHEMSLPIDELKAVFEEAYGEVVFKTVITFQDSLIYLLKVFGGEDLDVISQEINEAYSNPH